MLHTGIEGIRWFWCLRHFSASKQCWAQSETCFPRLLRAGALGTRSRPGTSRRRARPRPWRRLPPAAASRRPRGPRGAVREPAAWVRRRAPVELLRSEQTMCSGVEAVPDSVLDVEGGVWRFRRTTLQCTVVSNKHFNTTVDTACRRHVLAFHRVQKTLLDTTCVYASPALQVADRAAASPARRARAQARHRRGRARGGRARARRPR